MASSSNPHVLIMGGGIGGLALAHGLKKHNISVHVYERDRTQSYRAQGYRVRVRDAAVKALREVLDDPTYDDFELSCADFNVHPIPDIDAQTAKVEPPKLKDLSEEDEAKVTKAVASARCIDRSALRDVLIKRLDENSISYDKVFERYEETSEGVVAHFADGSTARGTLLVGADGKSSRVRKQLIPQLQSVDTGMRCLYGKTPITSELKKKIEPYTGTSMSFIKDRSREDVLIAGLEPITFSNLDEREARGLIRAQDYWFWAISGPPSALGLTEYGPVALSWDESEQKALEMSRNWHPDLRALIEGQAKGETSAFPINAVKPDITSWDPNEHITVLGDACHPMAPTGSGAVTAIQDAASLCHFLQDKGQTKTAIGAYEEWMRHNVAMPVKTSWQAIQSMANMKRENEIHMGEMAMGIRIKNVQQS